MYPKWISIKIQRILLFSLDETNILSKITNFVKKKRKTPQQIPTSRETWHVN